MEIDPKVRLLAFCLANGTMFGAHVLWLYRRRRSLADAATGAFLLTIFQILVTQMGLGALGQLRWSAVAGFNLLFSLSLWAVNWRWVRPLLRDGWQQGRGWWKALSPFAKAVAGLLLVALCWSALVIWFLPVRDYDGHLYHVPIAMQRFWQGDLGRLRASYPAISGYPENGEFWILWTLLWMRSQVVADGVPLVFWLLGMVAIYRLARRFGAGPGPALLGAGLWGFAPMVLLQTRTAYNDLVYAALFWLGLDFAYRRPLSIWEGGLAGLAAGLLLGIKYLVWPYVLILGCVTVWNFCHRLPRKRWGRVLVLLLLWFVAAGPSLYWYVANAVDFGNPVWPFPVSLGWWRFSGPELDVGAFALRYTPAELRNMPLWRKMWTVWMEPDPYYVYDSRLNGFGPLWPLLGLPALLVWLVSERRGYPLVALAAIPMLHPLSWHTRYALFLPGLGGIALAAVLTRFRPGVRWVAQAVYLVGTVFSLVVSTEPGFSSYFFFPPPFRTMSYHWGSAYCWFENNARGSGGVFWDEYLPQGPLAGEDMRHPLLYLDRGIPSEAAWAWFVNKRECYPDGPLIDVHRQLCLDATGGTRSQKVIQAIWPPARPEASLRIYRLLRSSDPSP